MAGEVVRFQEATPAPRRSFDEVMHMAQSFARSNLFGAKTVDQALALMMMAEAEGKHVATAMQDYDIIQGRPALKADAMLGRFQLAGGHVKWLKMTDDECSAEFSHPTCAPHVIDWDMERAKAAGLGTKDNWRKFKRQMLRARVIAEGVRSTFPACLRGAPHYVTEEVQDFEPAHVSPPNARQLAAPDNAETRQEPPSLPASTMELDGEEVDQSQQPEWPVLLSEMEAFSTREDLKAWWTTPEKRTLKQRKPHLARAFFRFAYTPRWEELGESVEWVDEAGARG